MRKKLIFAFIFFVIISVASTTSIYAFFLFNSQTVTNVELASMNILVVQTGETTPITNAKGDVTYTKGVKIKNLSTVPIFARVSINESWEKDGTNLQSDNLFFNYGNVINESNTYDITKEWYKADNNYYYRRLQLNSMEESGEIITSFTIKNAGGNYVASTASIDVMAESCQTGNALWENVFDVVNSPLPTPVLNSWNNEVDEPVYADISGSSAPELSSNMIPVKWDGNNWVKADDQNLLGQYSWYNYTNKEWANAVVVTPAKFYTYKNASLGTAINMNDILFMFVWIPRYRYAIPTGTGPRQISIVFEDKNTAKSIGDAIDTNYRTHPAFTFGNTELNGIWVGKFETGGMTDNVKIKPNIASLRNQSVASEFYESRNMQRTGNVYNFPTTGIDVHMMKAVDNGAIAYLTGSIYGKNDEVWINPANNYYTGCAGTSASSGTTSGCSYAYDTNNGMQASTTANIYGIYDLSGGANENLMAVYNKSALSSGFDSDFFDDSSNDRYYDLYTSTTSTTACEGAICYGQAVSETSGWYSDNATFVNETNAWSRVSGDYNDGTSAGIYSYNRHTGASSTNAGFRVVVTKSVEGDNTSPSVSFGANGSATYVKSRSTTVTVSDNVELDNDSLKYQWTTSTTIPVEGTFVTTFANGQLIGTPLGVTGQYYLWILAKDTSDNTIIKRSNVFNLDNTIPVITMLGDSPITIDRGSIYVDAGATANDDIDGDITGRIDINSTVNPNVEGTYTVTYNVSDIAGNTATPVIRTVDVVSQSEYVDSEGVNRPKLTTGMTAIKWNGSSWIDTTIGDNDWYDYTNKQWANARTQDGSIWVWIPRYIYKITSGWHSNTTGSISIQFTKDIDDNWNSGVIGTINTGVGANASNNTWTKQPAFRFGSTELTGIWVAKFEATASEGVANGYSSDAECPIGGDNVPTKTVKIIPNAISWRCVQIGNAFTASYNMKTNNVYGWGTSGNGIDTHLMKNIEWGAVAYLSKSTYGQDTNEIWINPANNYTTGCAGDSASSATTTGCLRAYETTNGAKASTTGNIYGIYDISGGSNEYVAAYLNNGSSSLLQGEAMTNATLKYKDVYLVGSSDDPESNYALAVNKKGDAVYETSNNYFGVSSWFGDSSAMSYAGDACLVRGGLFGDTLKSGAFAFDRSWCSANSYNGFRPILIVQNLSNDDTTAPTVVFGTNGNSIYANSRSTTVTTSDAESGLDTNSLKYQWTTSTSAPLEGTFTLTFTNGGTINTPADVTGEYYLWILAKDNDGNITIISSNVFNLDNTVPVITMNGNSPITIEQGTTYTDAGATASDNIDGDITISIDPLSTVNPNVPDTYTVTYNVSDSSGNAAVPVVRTVNVIASASPTVLFSPNGNSTYAKSRNITVTVSDNVAVDISSLKYQWTTSTSAPLEGTFSLTFTNGGTINTPADVTGDYYLWILAKDTATTPNTTIINSNVFNLDNTIPVITMLGSSPVTVELGGSYTDAGATASDNIDGDITGNIDSVSTVESNVAGSYTVTYNVSDSSGNAAVQVVRTINVTDTTAPAVLFGTNGNPTYAKSRSTTVTVSDLGGVNASSLKYQWTTSTSAPVEGTFSLTFTNGGTINTPADVTGEYYLWILAKDTATTPNTTIINSNVFNLDNTIPVITMLGSSPVTINVGDTYSDEGATASDNIDGDITANIDDVSTVNPNLEGNYTVTYNVSDSSGNAAAQVVRDVNVVPSYTDYIVSEGVNKPRLVTGMTAIKWNGSSWDNVVSPDTDTSWYDYTNKEWANAKTADGSFWVWIPRYIYKISSEWHSNTAGTIDVQFTKDTDDNWNNAIIGNINTDTTSNASNNTWTNTSAFKFGTTELTGIWVAKFEASVSDQSDLCYSSSSIANCDKTTLTPKIVPNASSWRNISIGNSFTVARNMETNNVYGWGTSGILIDTHLMKNVEWGAVAYLSKSIYGQNTDEIWINPAQTYTTGCAGSSVSSASTMFCSNAYQTTNGVKTSTTGTVYGIYDMSGGAWENATAYVDNGNSSLTTNGNSIVIANAKYKDIYTVTTDDRSTNYSNAMSQKGDALYETSNDGTGTASWFGDNASMAYVTSPWLIRGAYYNYAAAAGVFAFLGSNGAGAASVGFRPVLLIEATSVQDAAPPTVAFGTNGNSIYANAGSTSVTVSDDIEVDTSSLKYQWTTSTEAPLEVTFSTTFTNGQLINTPAGVTGGYYLWILAKDTADKTIITNSNIFHLDNTAPVITMLGSNPKTVSRSTTYNDDGATATDSINGDLTNSISVVSTVNTNVVGSYTVTYNISDTAGNAATQVVRTVNVAETYAAPITFNYTGNYQTFTALYTGTYKLEVWGAAGGTATVLGWLGGNGGYAYGEKALTAGQQLFVYVGGVGQSATASAAAGGWNGGGSSPGNNNTSRQAGSGGGATDIRFGGQALANRIIVAGGGGGSGSNTAGNNGGSGGGTTGGNAPGVSGGTGGTSNAGGTTGGALGTGGNGTLTGSGGGGGGYYGGGSGRANYFGGGGGSSYTGGVTGTVGTTAGQRSGVGTATITFLGDATPPVITILGSSRVTICVGDTYTDAGATATDNKDGDITANISTSNIVNTSVVGTYTVTYTVSDAASNTTQAIRTVIVSLPVQVNAPALATGMDPIIWDGDSWETVDPSDPSWYDYSHKKWANARTADGSMWVWIPRYIYKITSGWHSSTVGTIDIKFSIGTDDTVGGLISLDTGTTANASNNKWTNHMGFNFGGTELTGIWMTKFEATAAEGVSNGYTSDGTCPIAGDNDGTKSVKSVPNATSWRCITPGSAFTVSRNMETNSTYGWGTSGSGIDTHFTKMVEWGAVLYLSLSPYGKQTEIWNNPSTSFTTGCAGASVKAGGTSGCPNTYDTSLGVNASTTGNIYGIYDMAGCGWDRIAAYTDNGNGNLNTNGASIVSADPKYKDVYEKAATDAQTNNYALAVNHKGDAFYEITGNVNGAYAWYGNKNYMPYGSNPWFIHGGSAYWGSDLGVMGVSYTPGNVDSFGSFRAVLLVGEGL